MILFICYIFTTMGVFAAVIFSMGSVFKSFQLLILPSYLFLLTVSFCAIGQHLKDSVVCLSKQSFSKKKYILCNFRLLKSQLEYPTAVGTVLPFLFENWYSTYWPAALEMSFSVQVRFTTLTWIFYLGWDHLITFWKFTLILFVIDFRSWKLLTVSSLYFEI